METLLLMGSVFSFRSTNNGMGFALYAVSLVFL